MKNIEDYKEDELLNKITGLYHIVTALAPILIKKFWNPIKLTKIATLGLQLKKILAQFDATQSQREKIDLGILALQCILQFRKENPEQFNEIIDSLDEIVQQYQLDSNATNIKNAIDAILKD